MNGIVPAKSMNRGEMNKSPGSSFIEIENFDA